MTHFWLCHLSVFFFFFSFHLLLILLRSGQNCLRCEFFLIFLLLSFSSLFKSKGASNWGWARTGPAFPTKTRVLHLGCGSARDVPRAWTEGQEKEGHPEHSGGKAGLQHGLLAPIFRWRHPTPRALPTNSNRISRKICALIWN